MTEELVTLETAKLLKEKGFNEPCMIAINIEDSRQYGTNRTNSELPIKYVPILLNPLHKSGCVKPRSYTLKYPICMETIGHMIY